MCIALELFAARMMEGLKLLLEFDSVNVEIWDCGRVVGDLEGDMRAVRVGIGRV